MTLLAGRLGRPQAEQAAKQDDLAQVIGVMVEAGERLAKHRAPGTTRYHPQQVGRGIKNQALKLLHQ